MFTPPYRVVRDVSKLYLAIIFPMLFIIAQRPCSNEVGNRFSCAFSHGGAVSPVYSVQPPLVKEPYFTRAREI